MNQQVFVHKYSQLGEGGLLGLMAHWGAKLIESFACGPQEPHMLLRGHKTRAIYK